MDGYSYNTNQYSTTSYGAQGGNAGGGFMAGGESTSPAAKGAYGKDTLRPCTIKQILDATQSHPDADFKIDGHDLTQITFIGQIRNISTQTTHILYRLDDGTGTVEVKRFNDSDAGISGEAMDTAAGNSKAQLTENAYARVWGHLKSFNNKRYVAAHVIRPVTDLNEINHHLLEATAVHLFFTRGPPSSLNGNSTGQSALASGGGAATSGGGDNMGFNGRPLPQMSNIARRVFQTLKNTLQDHEGLHVQHLAAEMGTGVNEVQKGADELVALGLIYTTVDDNTWAILDF